MAEIRPLRAWRYNSEIYRNIESLTSPLFDVVSFKQLEKLYRNPHSSIHLSVPEGPDPASKAKDILHNWKINNIIQQDPIPGIYVYYQNYVLPGTSKEYWRKGFICNIRTYDWEEKVILNHENTMPHSGRLATLRHITRPTSADRVPSLQTELAPPWKLRPFDSRATPSSAARNALRVPGVSERSETIRPPACR